MKDELSRIIYNSSATIAYSDLDEVLADILAVARCNNPEHGITGMLAFHDGLFFQVIEGPKLSVDTLFKNIRHDGRNKDVIILDYSRVDQRVFAQWSMGWLRACDIKRPGFDAGVLRLGKTSSAMVNAMLGAFREVVRLD
jgi:hypothetical protein